MKKKNTNGVMMQYFEWYLPEECDLWNQLKNEAQNLADKGITALWLPPAYKGYLGPYEVGYAVYDIYDLGEFDQKGTVPTKYGTKQEYLDAIEACHANGIDVYADIVLNHMVDGDDYEYVTVRECDMGNRGNVISEERTILSKSVFKFPERNGVHDPFIWDHTCFSGSDMDESNKDNKSIYLFSGKEWSINVDDENGNFDYLLGLNIDFNNMDVVSHLVDWGQWYYDTCHMDGYRVDAVKHIERNFYPVWLREMRSYTGREMFAVGEYWTGNVSKLEHYLEKTDSCMSLFDVPLHYSLHAASTCHGAYDMSQIFTGTLTAIDPVHAVTFVDNHDTQAGQALQSQVEDWFLPQAYAIVLLRTEGYPCIFYGDYYGLESRGGNHFREMIDQMLWVRKEFLYGLKHEYIDNFDVIGWTVEGDVNHPNSGAAVILTDGAEGEKRMYVGQQHAGEIWHDVSGNSEDETEIDASGHGVFRCQPSSVSYYIKKTNLPQ